MEDHRKEVLAKLEAATREGLNRAAQIYVNAIKRELRGGYTSGDFVTGHVQNSVTRTAVERDGDGFAVRVGSNVPYAVFWEVGHMNLFTRKYERVEKWRPTMMSSLAAMQDAIRNAFKRLT